MGPADLTRRLPGGGLSLRARVALAAVLAVALGGLLAGTLLVRAVQRDGRAAVDADLSDRSQSLVREALRPGRAGGPRRGGAPPSELGDDDPAPPADEGLLAGSGTFVQLAVGGQVVRRRGDIPTRPPALPGADGFATVTIDGTPWRSLTFGDRRRGVELRVELLSTLAPVDARVDRIRSQVLWLGLLALALAAALAWVGTTVVVRPLARLRDGARAISGTDDLGAPLAQGDGPEEVRSLAAALNDMLARLHASSEATARALDATRRFAADVGHELRTPLAALRANLDALERNPALPAQERHALVAETLAEQVRMVALLEGLQALARGEAAERLPQEEVELADLVDAAAYAARRRHPGVEISLREGEDVAEATVRGWPEGLRMVVDNLLRNAAVHGGRRVQLALEREGPGALLLRVDDDGPGVAESDRARLLEPFARGAAPLAAGSGLGLAIVAQQVALHGGSLTLGDAPAGGLRVEVRLAETVGTDAHAVG